MSFWRNEFYRTSKVNMARLLWPLTKNFRQTSVKLLFSPNRKAIDCDCFLPKVPFKEWFDQQHKDFFDFPGFSEVFNFWFSFHWNCITLTLDSERPSKIDLIGAKSISTFVRNRGFRAWSFMWFVSFPKKNMLDMNKNGIKMLNKFVINNFLLS